MSRSTAIAQPPTPPTPAYESQRLRSDIAQFCLPGATKDASQKLAYVNSICIFTLAIGFIGIKAPQLVNREPAPPPEIMPVEIVQIQPQTPPEPTPIPENEPPPDAPVDMPQIATVVAADPSQVKFAIPVEGPVVFAPARFAEAPPANPPKATPPGPTKFDPNARGSFPKMTSYPRLALQQQIQGTVTLDVIVDTNGIPSSVEVHESSGSV
ncbi:MAG TPA: TonB family protein, partial [Verrucomicrobiae bacterium]|nr:TonB family protein [Verrucomicrobiae bacterium]